MTKQDMAKLIEEAESALRQVGDGLVDNYDVIEDTPTEITNMFHKIVQVNVSLVALRYAISTLTIKGSR
jgi:hypothetical protein